MCEHCFTPTVDGVLPSCRVLLLVLSRLLLRHNGRLMLTPVLTASALCTAVHEGDMPLLRRLLRAGADPNAGDYDKRTALHIAAADGNLPAVRGGSCCRLWLFLQPGRAGSRWLAFYRTAFICTLLALDTLHEDAKSLIKQQGLLPAPLLRHRVLSLLTFLLTGEGCGGCGWCQRGVEGQVGADTTGRGEEGGGNASGDVPAGAPWGGVGGGGRGWS